MLSTWSRIKNALLLLSGRIEQIPILNLRIGLIGFVFLYATLISVFVQFVFLPYIVPFHHEGNGIFEGIDTSAFHVEATQISRKGHDLGLADMISHRAYHPPAKLLSYIYYFFGENFYNIIPFNALVQAISCLFIFNIIFGIFSSRFYALLGSLPFAFFPFSILWYSQLHKDGLIIMGFFALFYALMRCFDQFKITSFLFTIFCGSLGTFCIAFMRPYLAEVVLIYLSCIIVYAVISAIATRAYGENLRIAIAAVALFYVGTNFHRLSAHDTNILSRTSNNNIVAKTSESNNITPVKSPTTAIHPSDAKEQQKPVPMWGQTMRNVISVATSKILTASEVRRSISGDARRGTTNVDINIQPKTVEDVAIFLPKALLNGLLAPYPSQWFIEGKTKFRSLLKKLVMIETLLSYFCFVFLCLFCLKNFRQRKLMLLVCSCLWFITLYGFIFVNVGTLYRMRYGFMSILIGLGFGAMWKVALLSTPSYFKHWKHSLAGLIPKKFAEPNLPTP